MTSSRSSVDVAIDRLLDAARCAAARELSGKVLGLVGYGTLGRQIARRAVRCGMEVLYADSRAGAGPHKRVLLGELLQRSDFVMLLPAAADLPRAAQVLPHLKPGARLVRIDRG